MSRKTYTIRVNGEERPAHEVWEKLEIANSALECLARFNLKRPELASEGTCRIENEVRARLNGVRHRLQEYQEAAEGRITPEARARELLESLSPEDTISILNQEYHLDLDLQGLVQLAGSTSYLQALDAEATMLLQNKILPEQIADLWNEAKRPALGKPFWDKISVQRLLDGEEA